MSLGATRSRRMQLFTAFYSFRSEQVAACQQLSKVSRLEIMSFVTNSAGEAWPNALELYGQLPVAERELWQEEAL